MNASALLTSQGWLGPGHALDSRLTDYGGPTYKQKGHRGLAYDPAAASASQDSISAGNGLTRPLLVSQRGGSRHGIGKKAHEPASGNEWWLKGFQNALQNIGKSESERTSAVNSGTSTPRNELKNGYVGKHGGLYGCFVTGQIMKGTLEEWNEEKKPGKKRKSDVLERDEKRDPLGVSPVKRVQTAKELETSIDYLTERDKERKRALKREQSTDVEQFAAVGAFLGATEDEKRKKGRCKETSEARDAESDARAESKEERRARRKRRKEGMGDGGLTLAEMVEEELARLSSMNNSERDDSAADEKAMKKAERKKKRRKEKE